MVANAQALERLGREVRALEDQIRHQQENDHMAQRYQHEPGTLAEKDAVLVGQRSCKVDAGRCGGGRDADGQA
ncbi:hypothetical protein [Mesorhizobium sp. B2-1-3A]|uniref:hypothetical protein n=1 Tax=Mesorhizobium sp. B2-1-3A TaxID=2589971 RepID=UPI00112921C5|nr:hypothetical protein [Mesorhizobium sp. B2-1-3A]TPM94687.1 hypothetical protein FJ977_21585 [Mesorhizobium sp. B2-1-3A]